MEKYGIIKYDRKNKIHRTIKYNNLSLRTKVKRKMFEKYYNPNLYMTHAC